MSYLLLVIITLVIGLVVQWDCHRQLRTYSQVGVMNGLTGAQVAHGMLNRFGMYNVSVYMGAEGQDHFDPRNNSISLSPSVYNGRSVTAAATACHEVGHACQYAQGYAPMKVRGSLVPVVNLASNIWIIVFIVGIFLGSTGFVNAAILLYAVSVLFHVVTLPVEFDASKRAKMYMASVGYSAGELSGASSVLRSCAMTYVAAALTSLLQLLWLLGENRD